jgi:hypothetical protein
MAKSDYRVATGWGWPLVNLVPIDPQPRSLGVRYVARHYLASGGVIDEGAYIELLWSALESEAVYFSLMSQFGLHGGGPYYDNNAPITLYARNELFQYHRFNAIACRPLAGSDVNWQYFPLDVTILCRNVQIAA